MQRGPGNFEPVSFDAAKVASPRPYSKLQSTSLSVYTDNQTGSYGQRPQALTPGLELPETYLRKMTAADMAASRDEAQPVAVTPTPASWSKPNTLRLLNAARPSSAMIPMDSVADAGYGGAPGDVCGACPNEDYPQVGETPEVVQAPTTRSPRDPIARGYRCPPVQPKVYSIAYKPISPLGSAYDDEGCDCAGCRSGCGCLGDLGDGPVEMSTGEKIAVGIGAAYLLWRFTR